MSEEIKSLKDYISTTKNEIFTTFKIETISNLIIYYEDLQQKVDRLNNIIKNQDRKIKLAIKIFENINKIYGESSSINDVIDILKENNNV